MIPQSARLKVRSLPDVLVRQVYHNRVRLCSVPLHRSQGLTRAQCVKWSYGKIGRRHRCTLLITMISMVCGSAIVNDEAQNIVSWASSNSLHMNRDKARLMTVNNKVLSLEFQASYDS